MRFTFVLIPFLAFSFCAQAQRATINDILQQIAQNNPSLKQTTEDIASRKLENKTENNLSDPQVSYSHIWERNSNNYEGELIVSQAFDFPSLYATRSKLNRQRAQSLDYEAQQKRQDLLLQAKLLCFDILNLQQQKLLNDERQRLADSIEVAIKKRLETGDANIIEQKKTMLEVLNARTAGHLTKIALEGKLRELTALNGGKRVEFILPAPIGRAAALIASDEYYEDLINRPALILDYKDEVLPASYEPLRMELLAADPLILQQEEEKQLSSRLVSLSRQGWIPKFEAGYRRINTPDNPLNGFTAGISIPLFENKHKVRMAKARQAQATYQVEDTRVTREAQLHSLYCEAATTYKQLKEYEEQFDLRDNLSLLQKAYKGGEISIHEFFAEVTDLYTAFTNYYDLQCRYRQVMAELYKSKLQ